MNLRLTVTAALSVMAVMMAAGAASATTTYDFNGQQIAVEYWTGTGSNEAMLVIDFGSGHNYAFGYRWNDGESFTRPGSSAYVTSYPTVQANTSEAMLLAVSGGGAFDMSYTYDDLFGFGVDSLNYDSHAIVVDPGWSPRYAAFFLSGYDAYHDDYYDADVPAMAADGVTWEYSNLGASTRILADGNYDGWTQGVNWSAGTPVTPLVPEPASLGVLMIGAAAVMLRRRTA